jgi:Cu(I)/Ag(I) efflux system membrane protein CusA/SilA
MTLIDRVIMFCLDNKLIVLLVTLAVLIWGVIVAPFDWNVDFLPRDPVAVDAIPDIGENQQIVFTEWDGRSAQDIENQITYPLTSALLGLPGVKTIRSYSYLGFSTIYVIFKDDVEFYWSRTRILEKLNSLPTDAMPAGVQPTLGPDATALGQVFWYTLEGRDPDGNPTGGWDLHELRSIQDWTVRYSLQSADGVSEVASIGGYVKEYQVDVNPNALRAFDVMLEDVFEAVRKSNIDVGAGTTEINNVEYTIRGVGFLKSVADLENAVVKQTNNVPVRLKDVATVTLGPAMRRGALDKGGAEVVGGVVVTRFGQNPLATIKNVKARIAEIAPGLPQKTLSDGTISKVTVVPFYDRTGLIYETLGTLNSAIVDEIIVTIIVVLVMVMHLRSSLLISGLLPVAVFGSFIGMKTFGVDANIMALAGIAIAIGDIVDMGIVICENILRHFDEAPPGTSRRNIIFTATSEVGSAVLTAIATTVVSFLPVFTMEAAEGKMFKPLAYTKTFALVASVVVALTIVPALAHLMFSNPDKKKRSTRLIPIGLGLAGVIIIAAWSLWLAGLMLIALAGYMISKPILSDSLQAKMPRYINYALALFVASILTKHWMPLGIGKGEFLNFLFVVVVVGGMLALFQLFIKVYQPILRWCLEHKLIFLSIPTVLVGLGFVIWLGLDGILGFMPNFVRSSAPYVALSHAFPGIGKEFMPDLDEGSFLYMPTTMPHASIDEVLSIVQLQDKAFESIPEVESVVGKLGRVESSLDPAPTSMIETIISYKSEYLSDKDGNRLKFKFDESKKEFARDDHDALIPDENGKPFRQWRDHIKSANDIWNEIVAAGKLVGTTSAPKLQPIAARIVMLQSGMRAPLGVKIKGPDLETVEKVGLEIEKLLKEVGSVEPATVVADRIVGNPYLEIDIDREAIARYGLSIRDVQDVIEVALGGMPITTTVEGRERYPVRVRYQRELRSSVEDIAQVLVPTADGKQMPLIQLAQINYTRGPMMIRSEDTFLTGYVIFDKKPGTAEVDVVQEADQYIKGQIAAGALAIPAGVSYSFAGSYENQVRSEKKLRIVIPLALFIIFILIYFQFRDVPVTALVFTGIFVAWAGGFLMMWLYGQDWFFNFSVLGDNVRGMYNIKLYNLSVAIWVGFLALFGVATDDGVLISTYIKQVFGKDKPSSVAAIREAIVTAGSKRIRPALMTVATTLLALIPVLTSTGKGSDVMVPMAIPGFGGMTIAIITVLTVPVLHSLVAESRLRRGKAL